jgi:hypothetical protein
MDCPGGSGRQIDRVRVASRFALALAVLLPAARSAAAEAPPSSPAARYAQVTVAPAKTSIYIGSVSLTVPPLTRSDGAYAAEYRAKVFPFFFFSEHGRLSIDFPDEDLHRLLRGETVQFKGRALNSSGEKRRIEGRAVPDAPGVDHGKIKIRVWAGKIELIFNSAYQFSRPG